MKVDSNILFITFIIALLNVGSMINVVCVTASEEAPLICKSSGKCPDSYVDQTTNEMKGITYCYSGNVEPDTAFEGNNQTIIVDGTPVEFNTIESCDDVTEDESDPEDDKQHSSSANAVRQQQQQLSFVSSKFVIGFVVIIISIII